MQCFFYVKSIFYIVTFISIILWPTLLGIRRGRDRMVGAISVYHHLCCEFEPRPWRGVLDTILCGKVCHWLATDWWFLWALRFPSPIKLTAKINWNIVESGVKLHQHKSKPTLIFKSTNYFFTSIRNVNLESLRQIPW